MVNSDFESADSNLCKKTILTIQLNDLWLEHIYIQRWIIDKDREHILTDRSYYLKSTLINLQYSEHTQAHTLIILSVCNASDCEYIIKIHKHTCKLFLVYL